MQALSCLGPVYTQYAVRTCRVYTSGLGNWLHTPMLCYAGTPAAHNGLLWWGSCLIAPGRLPPITDVLIMRDRIPPAKKLCMLLYLVVML